MNLPESANPAASRGVSERILKMFFLTDEDSPLLAAGSFNPNRIAENPQFLQEKDIRSRMKSKSGVFCLPRAATSWICVVAFVFCLIIPVRGDSSGDRISLHRITQPIILDGLSDEPAWEGVQPLPMTMHSPTFGGQASEKTDVLIGYDNVYIYVAGRMFMRDPAGVQATSKKRDFMGGNSDWFGIILDTFSDKENAVAFFTTPAGLRMDVAVFNDAQGEAPINVDWNTFWDVKTVRNDQGWFAEMRIPLSSLRFQASDDEVVMGLIAWRWTARQSEQVIFPAIPPNWGAWSAWKPSLAQEVTLRDVRSKIPLYVAPYVLTGHGLTNELNDDETAYVQTSEPELEAGLDVKVGLTSNLTMDLTLNTDFAQVEADDQQVNLTRFSLFFPEKRLFFQERSSNFDFIFGGPNRLFYSRRIGIHDGNPVRILGGARIVGRVGSWDVGLLTMQTDRAEDVDSQNAGVLRLRRRVINDYSYVGGIVTSRYSSANAYNLTYGLDGIFRVKGNDYLKVQWAQSFEDSLTNDPFSARPSKLSVNWERRTLKGFAYDLMATYSGADFNPGLGFQMRDDYTRLGNRILYGWISDEASSLLRHDVFLDGFLVRRNSDGSTESVEIGPGWEFMTKSSAMGKVEARTYYEDLTDSLSFSDDVSVPPGSYTFFGVRGFYLSPMGRMFYTQINLNAGSFYDGWRATVNAAPTWSVSSDLELSGFYEINRAVFSKRNQDLTAHIARLRATWMLSTAVSFSAFVQYSSAAHTMIANVRFRFNPREGNDFYLVFDGGVNTHRFLERPVAPHIASRTVLLKYTYTFQL